MPLCIINVDRFRFDPPKISWEGSGSNIIHSNGDNKTIILNTNYGDDVSKILQKFNGSTYVDVGEIDSSHNVQYDTVGSDRYRVKVTKGTRILYSNELTIVKYPNLPIAFDDDTSETNVCIKFVNELPKNVRSYNLVVISSGSSQRYPNRKCFQYENSITGVYVEYEFSDGYKSNSNTLDIVNNDNLGITWEGGGTENRTGYDAGVSVDANRRNVSWQVQNNNGAWIQASFEEDKIKINEGINKIRAILRRNNLISNELVYDRQPLADLSIIWESGGKALNNVINGTNLNIRLEEGYVETGINRKVMHTYVNGFETIKEVSDLSNMSFIKEGNIMEFKLKLHYANGIVLQSNTLKSLRLLVPKITWNDKTNINKSGKENTLKILKHDLVTGHTYKFQYQFREEDAEESTTDTWTEVEGDNINTSRLGYYKIRLKSTINELLVSNVLQYNRIEVVKNGSISWKGTTDTVVYNFNIPIVVNAEAPDEGGSYKIVATTVRRRGWFYTYIAGGIVDRGPEDIKFTKNHIGNPGVIYTDKRNPSESISMLETGEDTPGDSDYIYRRDQPIKENVGHTSEVDVSQNDFARFGLHYYSLVYTNSNTNKSYTVGKPLIAQVYNTQLNIDDYVYQDKWGISKQTPNHPQTRWEVKDSWSNENSRGFIYYGFGTPDLEGETSTVTLQKQTVDSTTWTDVGSVPRIHFTKERGVVKYRVKHVLHNGNTMYSNEVYTFYVGDILKFDSDKYYIVENIFNKKRNTANFGATHVVRNLYQNIHVYSNIENNHTINATLLPIFTYTYQISINGGEFVDIGNRFTYNNPLNFNDIFINGYPNGIVLIRLECSVNINTYTTEKRYSNIIYAMFNGATMSWQEDANDSVSGTELAGVPPYTFVVSDIYRYGSENNGELKIYVNKTNPRETTYQQIIRQNQVINTEAQAANLNKSINVDVQPFISYYFTISWKNSFGITHKGRSVLMGTKIVIPISLRMNHPFRIRYEVKTDYREAADIYYDYLESVIVLEQYVNSPIIQYRLQKADIGSDNFTDQFVLPAKDTGEYVIDRQLSQGKYRIKLTLNNSKHIYSEPVTKYTFREILKVNNKYSLFGFNNTVADSEYDNQTDYNITYNIENYPDNFRYRFEWTWSSRNILVDDTITTIDRKKVITMNSFVNAKEVFAKTRTYDIKREIGRKNGLVRIRLKIFENKNNTNTLIGYSNTIWIYLDNSIMYFVPARYAEEDSSFAPYVEGERTNNRRERLIGSRVFGIQCRHVYPEQTSRIYMTVWDGTTNYNKYRTSLNTITGDAILANRNRDPNVYLYHRKTYVPHFMVTLEPTETPLEQVIVTTGLENRHRWVIEEKRGETFTYFITTSGISSTKGNHHVFTYNNGRLELPFEFVLFESEQRTTGFTKANDLTKDGDTRNVDTNGLKEIKFTHQSNRGRFKKIRIKYKDKYIKETDVVYFEYFAPILSLQENRIRNDYVFYKDISRNRNIIVYANRTEEGYRYKFEQKIKDYNHFHTVDYNGTGIVINEHDFREYALPFTRNDMVSHNDEHQPLSPNKVYIYRLSIWRGDINIGYSNIVFFKT